MNRATRLLIALTVVAASVRLLSLFWLHPLNWDEVEYFRATDWVRQGLVPFRDFWEHHTPLQWFVFAPFTALTSSPGVDAVILMRLCQVPLWILTFALMNLWMRDVGLDAFARWSAITLAVCSSLLMIAAVEYRVDVLGCTLYAAALVFLQRRRFFWAGAMLCLAGFANLRLGPLLAFTAIAYVVKERRVVRLAAGIAAVAAIALLYFAGTGSLGALYQHVWADNYIGDKYAQRVPLSFAHRFLVPFGIRIYGGGDRFDIAGIDIAGALILILGAIGLYRALRDRRDDLFMLAILQVGSILFIAAMKFVYHYHLEIVVMMMLPFIALVIPRWFTSVAAALTVIAILVVVFRGKERDLAYQNLIMREAHERTPAGSKVFDGVGWALRREPAYRFWFLPELARQLVARGHERPLAVRDWIADPPAAVITDRNAVVWLLQNRALGSYVIHHYMPLWRNLWLPSLSARLAPEQSIEWIAPVAGRYRIVASHALATHPWFDAPFGYSSRGAGQLRAVPRADAAVNFFVNDQPVRGAVLELKKRDRLRATSADPRPFGIFATPGHERSWFREPPAGVTLDSEGPRVTHWPF